MVKHILDDIEPERCMKFANLGWKEVMKDFDENYNF